MVFVKAWLEINFIIVSMGKEKPIELVTYFDGFIYIGSANRMFLICFILVIFCLIQT